MKKSQPYYIAGIIFAVFAIMVGFILKPFLTSIILASLIAYIFYPVYRFLLKKTGKKNFSSLIVSIFIVLIITIPFLIMINTAVKEVSDVNIIFKNMVSEGKAFNIDCDDDSDNIACRINNFLKSFSDESSLDYYMVSGVKKITNLIIVKSSQLITQIPGLILNIFVIIFTVFYLLRDGHLMIEKLKRSIPLKIHHKEYIFKHTKLLIHGVLYGHMITAMIQGAIGGIGLFLFGISSPIIWGVLIALCALIPFIGTSIVWLPIGVFQLISGTSLNNPDLVAKGVGIILFGAFIISTIDNFIKPRIIGSKANIHPLLVLLGVLGGLSVFGFIGIFIGPIILSLFIALIDIYEEEHIIR